MVNTVNNYLNMHCVYIWLLWCFVYDLHFLFVPHSSCRSLDNHIVDQDHLHSWLQMCLIMTSNKEEWWLNILSFFKFFYLTFWRNSKTLLDSINLFLKSSLSPPSDVNCVTECLNQCRNRQETDKIRLTPNNNFEVWTNWQLSVGNLLKLL